MFVADGTVKMVQGVREVFEIEDLDVGRQHVQSDGGNGGVRGKLVFIGKGLDERLFRWSLERNLGL